MPHVKISHKRSWREEWVRDTESADDLWRVTVLLLIVTAVDDPLHDPDECGLQELQDSLGENVGLLVTQGGGHLGWLEQDAASGALLPVGHFMNRVMRDFFVGITMQAISE